MVKVAKILVVDDNASNVKALSKRLTAAGHEVLEALNGLDAIRLVEKEDPDLVLLDVMMPGMDGYETCKRMKATVKKGFTPVIMLTAKSETEDIVKGLESGADEYVAKPFEPVELMARINSMLRIRLMYEENAYLRGELSKQAKSDEIVGSAPATRRCLELARKIASENVTVLLGGETGTGKETFARAIHASGSRRREKFIAINCGAIPENLLESELFGHAKGAFTGATEDKVGVFEAAGSGTLFLDEIGETSLSMQVRLLRVLQEKEFNRVGETRVRKTNARVLAASNRDLEQMVKEGKFRQDLLYRLNVFPINLPSLRERKEDIPILAQHFLQQFCSVAGRENPGFTDEALQALGNYSWPGNIRELRNEVERAMILASNGRAIGTTALTDKVGSNQAVNSSSSRSGSLHEIVQSVESQAIKTAFEELDGNKTHMAKRLGISRWTLLKKMEQFGIG